MRIQLKDKSLNKYKMLLLFLVQILRFTVK